MLIAHLADIQVRAHSRHEEYEQSFEHIYNDLGNKKPDRIVLAGDIVHNKTNISPEQSYILSKFLRKLAEIADVDVILGNHDLAMKNLERLDALSPIIYALDNERIHFYRESGVYKINDEFQYVVMSCIDSEEEWNRVRDQADKSMVNICLWHGTVNGVLLDNGEKLESPHGLDLFKGLDYVMLGDIHKTQILDAEKRVAYPGSYPKQSYGEGTNGGYFLWDIRDKKNHLIDFVPLATVCPFYTLDLSDNLMVPHIPWAPGARIRVRCRALNPEEKRALTARIHELYKPSEFRLVTEAPKDQDVVIADNIKVENLREQSVQEKLLAQYFDGKSPEFMQHIFKVNATINSESKDDVLRNVRYKVGDLSFSNLFSFGSDNHIPFGKLNGIVGVFGKNGTGKSSAVVDIPLYCLFNKTSKGPLKNNDLVNQNKTVGVASASITVDADCFHIKRTTTVKQVKGKPQGVTDLEFKQVGKDLGGIDRAETDKKIRSLFGTAEDFMVTSVAPQFDLLGFVSEKATERKKTIARYLDLEFFEQKHKVANDILKLMKRQIGSLQETDFVEAIKDKQVSICAIEREKEHAERKAESDRRLYDLAKLKLSKLEDDEQNLVKERQTKAMQLKTKYQELQNRIMNLTDEQDKLSDAECRKNENCCIVQRFNDIAVQIAGLTKSKNEIIEQLREAVALFNEAKEDVAPDIQKVKEQTELVNKLRDAERQSKFNVETIVRRWGSAEADLAQLHKNKADWEELNKTYEAQEAYVKAMGKDGISYQIIIKNLEKINGEIEAILGDEIGFQIWLADDDKEINVWFKSLNDKPRLIELCSGMEKTMAAIAIRAALISVTSLPVSNVFVLDESFTSLDVEHIAATENILLGLKRIFDTILIICHNEHVKDMCDHILTVERGEDGLSRIV